MEILPFQIYWAVAELRTLASHKYFDRNVLPLVATLTIYCTVLYYTILYSIHAIYTIPGIYYQVGVSQCFAMNTAFFRIAYAEVQRFAHASLALRSRLSPTAVT